MLRTKKSKLFFKDKVKKLMRQKKNNKLKSLIENEETYPTVSDSTGTTLLHMAARYDNVEMIQYSIKSGCEVDAKDSTGSTPLTIATKYNHFSAVRLLFEYNVDIFTTNLAGECPLELAFNRNKVVFYSGIVKMYCEKVKSHCTSVEEAAEILLTAGCSLDYVTIIEDFEMIKIFLDKVERFDDVISCRSVLLSMFQINCVSLQILLSRGSQAADRIEDFFWYFHDMTNTRIIQNKQMLAYGQAKTLEAVRMFATKMIDWKILNEDNLKFIKYIFEDADKDFLQEFMKSGIVPHVKSHFNYNLLPHVYGNQSPGIIDLVRNTEFELEARGSTGQQSITALHLAVYRCIPSNVKLLLDMGTDPNVVDEDGETPLFCVLNSNESVASKIECISLLLRSNADAEVCDNKGNSFIEYVAVDNDDHLALVELVLAHLAMLAATDLPLKQSTVDYINRYDQLRSRYETCLRQLEEMKARKVSRSFSLMTVLTSKPDKIARFVAAQIGMIATLMHDDKLLQLNKYYSKIFRDHLDRALKVNELRCNVAHLIIENIKCFRGFHPVVDRIVSHFNFKELLAFK